MLKILLVEDEDGDAALIEALLAEEGLQNEIIRARDGSEALELLRGESDRPPLARPLVCLLDLAMPRMDGWEFLEALNPEDSRDLLIFVLTGSDDERDRERASGHDVEGFVVKGKAGEELKPLLTLLR